LAVLLALAGLAAATPRAAAAPAVHAHRGGSVLEGVPAFPENTLPAFQHAAATERAVVQLDVKLSADGVPVVIHDDSLDRTTVCAGPVAEMPAARIAADCKTDRLGSPGSSLPDAATAPVVPVPTLAEALDLAKQLGAKLNVEIKNLPTDDDFDPGPDYANRVMDVVLASGILPTQLIFQNFWPPNLDVAKQRMPGAETSLLTLPELNDLAPEFATARGYDWVSPAWPVDAGFVSRAHGYGLRVVPYTLNRAQDVSAAAQAGVDAVISDDPAMARRALGLPAVAPAPVARRVRISGRAVQLRRDRTVRILVGCGPPERAACEGTLALRTARPKPPRNRSLAIGKARLLIPVGSSAPVRVRVYRTARRLVRRLGRLEVVATARVRAGSGHTETVRQRLVLRAPRGRR
jgi:glycerophosphoryl diester phosphodiesterase